MDHDTTTTHDHLHDDDLLNEGRGTAPENKEGGTEAMGAGAGLLGGAAVGMAVGGPPGAVVGGAVGAAGGAGAGDQAEEEVEESAPTTPAERPY